MVSLIPVERKDFLKSSDLLLFLAAHSSREEKKKLKVLETFFRQIFFDASNHFTSQAINFGRLLFCAGAN
jgi:hypothetical protein